MSKSSKSTNQEQSVIFLHVPKAAGSTLYRIIDRQYKPTAIFAIDGKRVRESVDEFKNLPKTQREGIKFLKGHMYFGLHESLPQPSTYITILRDPVERIISHYYYVLRSPDHYLYKKVTSQNMSLKDYVCSGISTELDNGQTRLVSGLEQTVFDCEKCSANVLELAKMNLRNHFAVVGLSERFDETLILLQKAFAYKIPFYLKKNVTNNRPLKENISQDTVKYIEEYNQLDIELYDYAKTNFENVINQQESYFKRELEIFKLLNMIYVKTYSFSRRAS